MTQTNNEYRLQVRRADGSAYTIPYVGQLGREHVRAEARRWTRSPDGSVRGSVEIQRPSCDGWVTVETVDASS